MRVLLVEDNEMNLDMLSRRLQRQAFDVCIAQDGHQAIYMAASESPDIILMDMSLPGLDGWQATREIRRNPDCNNIPIIGLSAHAMEQDRNKALQAGCDAYETKPVDFNQLLSTINRLLNLPA